MEGEGEGEARSEGDHQSCVISWGVFHCSLCFQPLGPPILQCRVGHFVCSSCSGKLPDSSKCHVCSREGPLERSYGMERVVDSILFPCAHAGHGCTDRMPYYRKKGHERACPHAPCFCPDPGCAFAGTTTTAALLDHFAAVHRWPTTAFRYSVEFDLPVRPGLQVLRGEGGHLFLVNMASVEQAAPPLGHAVALTCVRPHATDMEPKFGCSVYFSCFEGHRQVSVLDVVGSSSLVDGPTKDYFCVVPWKSNDGDTGVVLRTTIDVEPTHDDGSGDDDDNGEEEGLYGICWLFRP